jgi:hypothetical protein
MINAAHLIFFTPHLIGFDYQLLRNQTLIPFLSTQNYLLFAPLGGGDCLGVLEGGLGVLEGGGE